MAPFEILPALDLSGGSIASMRGGDPSTLQRMGADPLEAAQGLVAQGARWLHVVDLDAAVGGAPQNLAILRAICELPVRVQAGGGLSPDGVEAALAAGAERAVLGSAALGEPEVVRRCVAAFGVRLAVGLDVRGGFPWGTVAPRGRSEDGPAVEEVLRWLPGVRPGVVVFTSVESDGALSGPDLSSVAALARLGVAPVIASGGVRSRADLDALRRLDPAPAGAIVGRALHDGAFSLAEALSPAEGGRPRAR